MKKILLPVLATLSLAGFSAQAKRVQARVDYLSCTGFQVGVGGGTLALVGGVYTLTETNAFGVPLFSQVLTLEDASSKNGSDIKMTFTGQTTNKEYVLKLESGAQSGVLVAPAATMDMTCVANISKAE